MTENGSAAESAGAAGEAPSTRGRSTIEFPYLGLDNAIEVAQAIHEVAGGMSADTKQLAVKLQMAPDGGAFRVRLMTAKTFRLVEYGRGDVELTELGMRIVDPNTEKESRLEAFMAVPLYKALFDRLNGQPLPPQPAVERMAAQLGVAPKQTDRARQAFMRSARTAGLFELSGERLSLPPGLKRGQSAEVGADSKTRQDSRDGKGGSVGGGGGDDLHPFIRGLLQKLPAPDAEWAIDARAKWLLTASNIFDLMYKTPAGSDMKFIEVEVKNLGAPT
jgi:hypothetical protein